MPGAPGTVWSRALLYVLRDCGAARTPARMCLFPHPNLAHNLTRSFLGIVRKRCNSNDANSMFEQATGELRATLLGNHKSLRHKRPGLLRTLPQRAGLALTQPIRTPMGATPLITTNNPQNTRSTKPDQATTVRKNHLQKGAGGAGGTRHSQATNIRIGNEHPDSLLTYPHPHNLSGYSQPIHEVPRHKAQRQQAGRRGFRAGTRGGSRRDRRTPDPRGVRAGTRGGYRSTRPSSAHSAPASSRLRPNDRQPWRRRRIHRRRPPAAAAPRPAPPTRPSKPVRARRCMRLVSTAGASGAT